MPVPIKNCRVSLSEVAQKIGGRILGDLQGREIFGTGLCPLDAALEGHITFARKPSPSKIVASLAGCKVAAVIISDVPEEEVPASCPPLLVTKDPLRAMISLIPLFFEEPSTTPRISPLAHVASSATVAPDAIVSEFCSIGEGAVIEPGVYLHPRVTIYPHARIGARSVLHSGVSIREACLVGSDCILHNGVVIGADGFGYIPDAHIGLMKVPQVGIVKVGNHVEIGANACVDRATFGITEIGDGTKIDNLAQVGHNVRVGRSSIICGQVGIAGSCTLGSGVVIGAQSGVADHLMVSDRARVAAKSGVTSDIKAGDYAGFPAVSAADWRRQVAAVSRLPQALRKLRGILREGSDT
jgi:UDP-3-O-[3-hydroxymyristoyl] glucosamine N-acyltransferase